MKKKNLFVLFLTLLIYLFIGGTGFNNAILCLEENGNVKIEFGFCHNSAEASTIKSDKQLTTHEKALIVDNCGKCTDIPLFTDKTDNQYFLNVQTLNFQKDNTIYFYYPVIIEKLESKPFKSSLFEQLSLNYSKFSFINTTTTVLLN